MLPGRELTIDSMVKVLRHRRWLFIGPLFLGVLGGLLYFRAQPSLYRSDAVVQVVPQRIPDSYVQSTVTARVEDRLSSISQQVLSRTQLEAVIIEFDLYHDERRSRPMEDVSELMSTRVRVAPIEGARRSPREPAVDAFRISFDYEDPRTARDVVGKLAGFFIDGNARERGAQADQTSAFLEAQLADARGRLESQEQKLERFRERNAGSLPTQMPTNMQAIQNTQLALQAMVESLARDRDRKLMLERLYSDAAANPPTSAPVPSAPVAPTGGDVASRLPGDATPQQRLEAARSLLTRLEVRLSAKHPDVVRTKRLIEDLERQVALDDVPSPDAGLQGAGTLEAVRRRDKLREMRAEIESLDRQIAFKEGEERRLREQIGVYQARLEAVPAIESEWVALTRDYDTLQATYRELLSKSENSKMAASLEQRQIGEQFRILDPPRVPLKPYSPDRLRINALGTLSGLGLGLLLVGLVAYRDSTMRSEADVLGAIKLPVLALVPYATTQADHRRQRQRHLTVSAAAVAVSVATGALFWFLQLWKFVV